MSVLSNIEEFWDRFLDVQDALLESLKNKDYPRLMEIVGGLDEESYAISGAHFFVEDNFEQPEMTFDAGPNKTTQYICQQMRKLAPLEVKKIWVINDVLPPLSQKAVEAQVQIKDQIYTLFDFTAFYEVFPEQQAVTVKLYCPGFSLIDNPEHKREMCIYLTELAVGELIFESYISSVDFLDVPAEGVSFCNLTDLYEVILGVAENGNWKEYKSPTDIFSVYQPHQDFAHDSLRKDMKLIFTTHPLLIEESLGDGKDVVMDLQAKDGEYGYVYYANPFSGKDDALFRQELSKKIDTAFAPLHCAKVIGGAIGKSFSYIDLIVFDKAKFRGAFKQIQEQLHDQVEIHYRSFDEKN